MDNIVFEKDVLETKYRKIVEETIIECNRVMDSWVVNEKRTMYDDYISLLRSYISRYIRKEFPHTRNTHISTFQPLCVVRDNKIARITFSPNSYKCSYHPYLNHFATYLDKFDFDGFNNTLSVKIDVKTLTTELIDINFDNIKKIKF